MESLETIGLLGKLPSHGDFIHLNARSDLWRLFDAWIQEGFYHAQQRNIFKEGYADAEGYAFYFPAENTGGALTGFFQPSQDTIGRKFPLIVAHEITSGIEASSHPILKYNYFLMGARQLAVEGASGKCSRSELNARLEKLARTVEVGEELEHDAYQKRIMWKALAEDCWSSFEDPQKYLPFKNLAEIVFPLREGVPSHFTLGFRFSGCKAQSMIVHAAAFWFDAFRRVLAKTSLNPCLFWRLAPGEGEMKSSVLVFLEPPPAKVMVDMLPTESDSDHICDMDQIGLRKKDSAGDSLEDELKTKLDDQETNLAEVLHQLR